MQSYPSPRSIRTQAPKATAIQLSPWEPNYVQVERATSALTTLPVSPPIRPHTNFELGEFHGLLKSFAQGRMLYAQEKGIRTVRYVTDHSLRRHAFSYGQLAAEASTLL